jgi:hypothetical protein
MRFKNITLTILLITFVSSKLFSAGGTGLAFLKISGGARPASMGDAYVASGTDVSSLLWNPSSIAWIENRQVQFTYNKWIQDINHQVLSSVWPSSVGNFSFHVNMANMSGIERRKIASEKPLGEMDAHDLGIGLGYARMFGDNLSLGLQIKYLYEKIYIETANGIAIDMGLRYETQLKGMFLGIAVQNLGSTTKLLEEKIKLPQILRSGLCYQLPFQPNWYINMDFIKILEEESHINVGSEVKLLSILTLRAGYQTGYEEKSVSAGFGLSLGPAQIDFAYIPFRSDLGNSQLFSCMFKF